LHRRNLRGERTKGYRYPTLFGLKGTVPLTFQDEKVKNLLSPDVNRGDLRRITVNPFSAGAPPRTPLGELTTLSQTPELMRRGHYLPILLHFRLWTQGRLVLLLNWYTPLFRPKLRPWCIASRVAGVPETSRLDCETGTDLNPRSFCPILFLNIKHD